MKYEELDPRPEVTRDWLKSNETAYGLDLQIDKIPLQESFDKWVIFTKALLRYKELTTTTIP